MRSVWRDSFAVLVARRLLPVGCRYRCRSSRSSCLPVHTTGSSCATFHAAAGAFRKIAQLLHHRVCRSGRADAQLRLAAVALSTAWWTEETWTIVIATWNSLLLFWLALLVAAVATANRSDAEWTWTIPVGAGVVFA